MTNNKRDMQLLAAFVREIEHLSKQSVVINLQLTPDQAMAMVGALQLACRHSGYTGPSRVIVERIVHWVQSEFLQYRCPTIIEVIRRGWDSNYDTPKEKP